jgi:hypothetical protein
VLATPLSRSAGNEARKRNPHFISLVFILLPSPL